MANNIVIEETNRLQEGCRTQREGLNNEKREVVIRRRRQVRCQDVGYGRGFVDQVLDDAGQTRRDCGDNEQLKHQEYEVPKLQRAFALLACIRTLRVVRQGTKEDR